MADVATPRGSELLRYGLASAAIEADGELRWAWASSTDRAVRRAIMRSPELEPEVAERVVATRRSGMHTLGANPAAPVDLLASNPSALRRRARIDAALPGGLASAAADPNRDELLTLDSETVDLVVARSAALRRATALALASRAEDPADPWVLAVLAGRFGPDVWLAAEGHAAAARLAAARELAAAP